MSATLTGQTNAYFSDSDTVTGTIQAGTWETEEAGCSENGQHEDWDCSSLKFVGGEKYIDNKIFAYIKNTGSDMKTNGTYEIYYIEKGNPKNGKPVGDVLTFAPIEEGLEIELSFTPTQSGTYMFKAYQHRDHPGQGELWSAEIKVDLKSDKAANAEEEKTEQQAEQSEETTNEQQLENKAEETSKEAVEIPVENPVQKPEEVIEEKPEEKPIEEQPKFEETPKEESKHEEKTVITSEAPAASEVSNNGKGD
jgi:TasA anchoring/assembly protein